MAFDYLNEAFRKLDLLEESMFNTSYDGINQLSKYIDEDDDTIRVIDPEAESSEEIKDSYVGKVIINCNICHSHIFENKEDIVIDEEGIVNVESVCPYCGESEGFTVVGEIVPFDNEDTDSDKDNSVEDTSEIIDTEIAEEESNLEEGLLGAVGLGFAAGAASAVGNKVTSSILGDDINDDTTDEVLTEEPKMSRASKRSLKESTLEIDTLLSLVGGIDNVRNILTDAIENHPELENNVDELTTMTHSVVEDALTYEEWSSIVDHVYDSLFENNSLTEDFKEVSIKTEDQKLEMTSDENGKVTVTTEPVESSSAEEEIISPISAETQEEILDNNDVSSEEEFDSTEEIPSEDELEFDIEDIDEEGMDELGESYLRKIYENVKSFKTSSVGANENNLVVEGIITFNSGVQKRTGFLFEAKDANSRGQLRFIGSNKHMSESSNAFTLVGKVDNKKLFLESLKYNYTVDNNTVRGVVRRK